MRATAVPEPVPRGRLLRLAALLATVTMAVGVRAIDEAQVDFAVLTELNRIELYDYAELLVEQMEAKYPDRLGEVLVEKARTYFSSGKSRQAEETLDRIKPGSPSFPMALLLRAEVSALRGRNEDAAKAYAQFFQTAKAPPPENQRASEVYTRAVTVYSTVLKRLGKGAEAAKALELLGKTAGASDRKLAFLKAQTVIDTEESKFNDKGPVQRAAIQEALKQLQDLLFVRDGVAVSAYLETARGQILLAGDELNTLRQQNKGKEALKVAGFKQALDTVRMVDESDLLRDVEKEVSKGQGSSASPYAGALYFKAEAYRGLALAHYMAGEEDTSRKLARAAAKLLEAVVTDYGESDYRTRALARHEKCSAFLEQAFGEKVALSDANADAELAVKLEQAQALLLNKNYQGAIPLYLEALRLGRRSKRLPEVASRLIVCLGSTDRFLEAQAIGSYLAQVMPKAEGTPDCLFRLGGLMYEKAKALSGPAKEAMLGDAMEAWELFVEAAPDHAKAPEVCFAIAEHYYRLATDLADHSRKAPEAEREPLKAQAREAFLAAVPKYQRLVERYSSQDKGVRGLYKLGWIHTTAEQPTEAVDAFLRYCETETLAQHADDRLEAKFRAAEQLMLGDTPAEAVEHYLELLSWLEPDNDKGFDPRSKAALRLKEDASSYLAWAYDLSGEKLRPETSALREALADCARQRRAADDDIRAARDRLQTLAADRERYQKEAKDLAQALAAVELDFTKLAQAEIAKRPEAQADPVRLATEMEARAKARVRADIETRQAEQEALTQERTAHEQRTAEAEARVAAATTAETAATAAAKASGERLRSLRDAAAAAERAIVEGEAASRQLEDQLQKLQEQREASEDPAARGTLDPQIQALAAQLAQTREKTAAAYEGRERTAGPAAEKQMAEVEATTAAALANAGDAAAASGSAGQQHQLVALDGQILAAKAEAVAKALAAASALGAALEQPAGAARVSAEPKLREQAQAAVTAFAKGDALQGQRFDLLAEIATARTQAAEARIAQVAAAVTELEGKLKPLQDALLEWKRKAQVAFESFLKAYPKSKHVPRNLARLGGVFLELEQYDQAATVLNRLNTEFADSEAAQEAMFGLGRAQWEQGDHAKAAESFGKLLQKPVAVSAANLAYVSERMLEKGAAAVSLKASLELLARSAKANDPEGARVRARAREPALFRAGQACLDLKAYDEAQKHFSTLLGEYPRTGLFFEAKFGLAQARRNLVPPDLGGALADLAEVVQFSQDPVQANRALCLVGEVLAAQGDPRSLQQAVARFQQVVLLSDAKIEGNRPWIETAIVESAKAFARLGNTGERDAMVALYRQRFPNGSRAQEISSLPTGTARPAAPAEQSKP